MHTIDVSFVGHGYHEELIAHVADQERYYGRVGDVLDAAGGESARVYQVEPRCKLGGGVRRGSVVAASRPC